MSVSELHLLACKLQDAAEKEDWETAFPLIEMLAQTSHQLALSPADKNTLTLAINALNQAISATQARKEQVRQLADILG